MALPTNISLTSTNWPTALNFLYERFRIIAQKYAQILEWKSIYIDRQSNYREDSSAIFPKDDEGLVIFDMPADRRYVNIHIFPTTPSSFHVSGEGETAFPEIVSEYSFTVDSAVDAETILKFLKIFELLMNSEKHMDQIIQLILAYDDSPAKEV